MSDQYDSTGWYHQNGWRRDCTGKWYPPDRSPGPGWRIADDGVWYPPQGWWLASNGHWYPPQASPRLPEVSNLEVSRRSARVAPTDRSPDPDDEVASAPETTVQPLPPPAWHPDPDDPLLHRYWDGAAWTEHTAPRFTKTPSWYGRTRWGTVSLQCTLWGGVLMITGFVAGIGTRPPDPGEEDTYQLLIGALSAAMLAGFLLQVVALTVGLIGRWRLGPNHPDPRLSKALWISGSVVAVGTLLIAAVAAGNS